MWSSWWFENCSQILLSHSGQFFIWSAWPHSNWYFVLLFEHMWCAAGKGYLLRPWNSWTANSDKKLNQEWLLEKQPFESFVKFFVNFQDVTSFGKILKKRNANFGKFKSQNLDFANNNFTAAYHNFVKFLPSFDGSLQPKSAISPARFKSKYPCLLWI